MCAGYAPVLRNKKGKFHKNGLWNRRNSRDLMRGPYWRRGGFAAGRRLKPCRRKRARSSASQIQTPLRAPTNPPHTISLRSIVRGPRASFSAWFVQSRCGQAYSPAGNGRAPENPRKMGGSLFCGSPEFCTTKPPLKAGVSLYKKGRVAK